MRAIALVMLATVGYSSGVTLAGRAKRLTPREADLVVMVAVAAVALALRGALGRGTSLAAGLLIGLVAGAGVAALRRAPRTGERRLPSAKQPAAGPWAAGPWAAWRSFAVDLGNFQSRLLTGFFYFTLVTPFALLSRVASDPLRTRPRARRRAAPTIWLDRPAARADLGEARRQF